jgi:hypothetical protein
MHAWMVGVQLDQFVKLVSPPIMLDLLPILFLSFVSSTFLRALPASLLSLQLLQSTHLFSLLYCTAAIVSLFQNSLFSGCLSF